MHEKNVLHRDIKSKNIVCNSLGEIKICDLGFSAALTQEIAYRRTVLGTAKWMSPEILKGKPYSKEVDVWAFGVFAYELAMKKTPFAPKMNHDNKKYFKCMMDLIMNHAYSPIDDQRWSSDFNKFIERCLEKETFKRATI